MALPFLQQMAVQRAPAAHQHHRRVVAAVEANPEAEKEMAHVHHHPDPVIIQADRGPGPLNNVFI